jgi:hypothetical protein
MSPWLGSTVTIYVYLLDEGVDVWRQVQADPVEGNLYRIVSRTPRGERWEFGEGETVRCETRALSGQDSLVAVERIDKP